MKRHNIKDREITPSKIPDVRPLDQRLTKRIKPGQQPNASEQLIFNTGETIEPDYDLEPAYIKKLKNELR